VSRVSNALVTIVTKSATGNEIARGSGFVFLRNTIATNLHVFKWADHATVKLLSDGVEYPIRSIVAFDISKDVCVLDVDISAATPLALGDSSRLQVGEDIIVAGSPRGFEGSFSKGIVSGLRKAVDSIQIDASISPGSSGGPVVNMKGEVIGIATATLTESQNLNFAVPASVLLDLEYSWKLPVHLVGALSVTDAEAEGLRGPVRTVTEKIAKYHYEPAMDRDVREPLQTELVTTYTASGRVQSIQFYKNGAPTHSSVTECDASGLVQKWVDITDGKRSETLLSKEEAIPYMALRVPFGTTADVGSNKTTTVFYDDYGNITEARRTGVVQQTCTFAGRRETECRVYDSLGHYVDVIERYSYEEDRFGNWTVKHEIATSNRMPERPFPSADYVREITYYPE